MKNILKTKEEQENRKGESFKESFIDKLCVVIASIVEFVWGCFVAMVGLGIFYVIIYGLSYVGVASMITATIWKVGCGAGAIIFCLCFLGNISMIHTSFVTKPILWLAMALIPGIFFVRALMFA
ncbi:hypothetical protein [Acetobacterium wieringae]|jgi:hypothetical protein|uniref:Uncharacterized protein n=1 Tax=Acetobacterium wieringae TaxID=52694 RepID=A0A1F2PJP0_9FIRM|nr:hypothetical protein [Acetobacterium wieringae]OFV71527.1 hypothetical protein ACWI_10270 [Acetobacterium wieringae]